MTGKTFRFCVLVLALYWAGIFTLTHIPISRPPIPMPDDKAAHFLAYLGLGILLNLVLRATRSISNDWIILAIGLSYGVIDELTQKLVGRTCDQMDWFADCAGMAVAMVLCGAARALFKWCRRGKVNRPAEAITGVEGVEAATGSRA